MPDRRSLCEELVFQKPETESESMETWHRVGARVLESLPEDEPRCVHHGANARSIGLRQGCVAKR